VKKPSEYDRFEITMRKIMAVPHAEIKAKLDEEKNAKKRKKANKSSASREASGRV
jgi:hypothetical protein